MHFKLLLCENGNGDDENAPQLSPDCWSNVLRGTSDKNLITPELARLPLASVLVQYPS